jgi:hypothetical protein
MSTSIRLKLIYVCDRLENLKKNYNLICFTYVQYSLYFFQHCQNYQAQYTFLINAYNKLCLELHILDIDFFRTFRVFISYWTENTVWFHYKDKSVNEIIAVNAPYAKLQSL